MFYFLEHSPNCRCTARCRQASLVGEGETQPHNTASLCVPGSTIPRWFLHPLTFTHFRCAVPCSSETSTRGAATTGDLRRVHPRGTPAAPTPAPGSPNRVLRPARASSGRAPQCGHAGGPVCLRLPSRGTGRGTFLPGPAPCPPFVSPRAFQGRAGLRDGAGRWAVGKRWLCKQRWPGGVLRGHRALGEELRGHRAGSYAGSGGPSERTLWQ